jgi:hypothetical protein
MIINSTSPEFTIINWGIDDGVSTRGHRDNLFNDKFKKVGVGIVFDAPSGYAYVCMTYASTFSCASQYCQSPIPYSKYDPNYKPNNTSNSSNKTSNNNSTNGVVESSNNKSTTILNTTILLIFTIMLLRLDLV